MLWLLMMHCFDCPNCGWAPKAGAPSIESLRGHLSRSSVCKDSVGDIGHHADMVAARARHEAQIVHTAHSDAAENKRRSVFARQAKKEEALFLSTQRYDKLQSNTNVQSWKEGVPELLKSRRKELMRRLTAGVTTNGEDLEIVVGDVMNIFQDISTEKREAADLRGRLGSRHVKPQQRSLGTRTLQTTDTEGFTCGEKKTSERFCYDLPIDQTLGALLQHDERARRQFRAASRRWAAGAGDASGSEKIYFDIPDGKAFKSHPMLGTSSPEVDGFKGAIMLYYDGFEVG
jgi:hypothetical protein